MTLGTTRGHALSWPGRPIYLRSVHAFDSGRAVWREAGRARMFSYLAIFAVSLAGYAGMSPLAIGIGALALLALSVAEQNALLERGRAVGGLSDMRQAVFGVAVAGTIVTTAAYAAGLLLRFTATT